MAYTVAVCGSYLIACGNTSNMQLTQNNLSLQTIWSEVNWSRFTQVSRCQINFVSLLYLTYIYVIVLVSLLNRMFAFMLHSEYTMCCFMAKSVVRHNVTRQTFHCFVLNIQPSECKYVLFVCLSVRLTVHIPFIPLRFRYFGLKFSFRRVDLSRRKQSCATHSTIFAEKKWHYISRACRPRKLIPTFLRQNRENIPLHGTFT